MLASNLFARLLVLVNVALSVGLLAWALTLSSNRLDWVDAKTETGTVKGQITLLKEEIDRSTKGATDLSAAYAARTQSLAATEAFRASRKNGYTFQGKRVEGYDGRLAAAAKGAFLAPVTPPGEAFIDLTKAGTAEPGPDGKPLRGTDAIQADITRELQAANRALAGDAPLNLNPEGGLDAALADNGKYEELTARLGFSDLRKLQTEIATRMAAADLAVLKQKEIRTNLRDEAQQLAGVRVNWRAQLADLQARQGQLGRRLTAFK